MLDSPVRCVVDWPLRELSTLATKIGSGATPRGGRDVYIDVGVALIRSQNVHDHSMSDAGLVRITDVAATALNGVEVIADDVLLNITGDSIARCAIVDPTVLPARVNQHVAIIRTTPELDPHYLQRYLCHPDFKSYMFAISSGGTRNALTKAQIESFPVLLPPLAEQRAMSAMLGALDDKIAVNERILDTLSDLAMCRFKELSKLGGWGLKRISEVADVYDGPHATPRKTEAGPWFLSISSLRNGRVFLAESAHLSDEDFARWTRRVTPRAGDLLFSYETRLGEAALMPSNVRACLGRRMALMRPHEGGVDSRILLLAYLNSEFQDTIRTRTVHGATVDRIPLVDLPSWEIRLPDPSDQRPLAHLLGALHDRMEVAAVENRVLAELRDALLPKLISGEMRIKGAEKAVEDAV